MDLTREHASQQPAVKNTCLRAGWREHLCKNGFKTHLIFSAMISWLLWDIVPSQTDPCPVLGKDLSACDLMETFPGWAQNKRRGLGFGLLNYKRKNWKRPEDTSFNQFCCWYCYSCVLHSSVVNYSTNTFLLICGIVSTDLVSVGRSLSSSVPFFSGFSWDFSGPPVYLSAWAQPLNILKEHQFCSFYEFSSWRFFYFLRSIKVQV